MSLLFRCRRSQSCCHFSCAFLMLSSTLWWIWFLKEVADLRTLSNISLSNGSSKFERTFALCLMSIGTTASLLYKSSSGEHFVDACVVTRSAKSTPSIIYGKSVGLLFSTFINEHLIVLFCLSTRPFACGWYALVTRWMVPVRRCSSAENLLTNFRHWSFISVEKQSCLHISSYKNCETAVAFLSWSGFASDYLLK